ncbi:Tether containing UBX domain for GLUT4 [Gigaspora margarita]|uniref:Tether containing UBX domain for GLUT4 n=1 Tax=Gigaspora margarita TaxID=4874 RepID=A0A8H3XDH2_GIGMA|nr:Tether containing UBX domain for GLUT4 [Gigaspora margarita]
MASNVVVLLSNAKKQTVKTTPTMPLKQIVTIVCEKQGYTDVESYGLKLNKKTLDLGLPMRFANLAPGAKLELIKVSAPKAQKDVQIALQLDDGGRMIEKFPITTSIWDILLHFEKTSDNGSLNLTRRTAAAPPKKGFSLKKFGSKSSEKQFYQQPVCLILNKEYGTISLLKSTTLQSAGIISGNAVLRLLFRQTELILDDVVRDIEASLQTPEVLESVNTPMEITSETVPAKTSDEQPKKLTDTVLTPDKQQKEPIDTMNNLVEQQKEPIDTKNDLDEQQKEPIDTKNNLDEQQKEPIDTTNNLDEQQKEPIDTTMNDPDEQPKNPIDTMNDPDEQPKEQIDTTMNDPDEQPKEQIDTTMNDPDEQPKEQIDTTMNDPDEQPKEQTDNAGHFDRDIKVFNPPPENVLMSNKIDLPDSFYELTAAELQYLLAKQALKHKMEENSGFKTSAMRAKEEKERERKYPKTLIRVKFPDSFQLQIAFLSKEHVAELYKFVKSALRTPSREFELYVSPPKRTLSDKNITLYQAGLSPASVVYCIWADKSIGNDIVPYLSDEYLKLREDLPNITAMEITEDTSASFVSENLSAKLNNVVHQQRSESSKNREKKEKIESSDGKKSKFPKWFKKQ